MHPERLPKRGCCDSKINDLHRDECINADVNAKWRALGIIEEERDGRSYRTPLSGDEEARPWGVRIGPTAGTAPRSVAEPVYRDLADVFAQEEPKIKSIADELVADVTGRSGVYPETYHGVAEFFVANLILLFERNEMAHDAWRATGWAGNLMTLWGKAKRLMNNLWWFPESDSRKEKPLDHLGDTAIYSAFTAILWMAGDERGAER